MIFVSIDTLRIIFKSVLHRSAAPLSSRCQVGTPCIPYWNLLVPSALESIMEEVLRICGGTKYIHFWHPLLDFQLFH